MSDPKNYFEFLDLADESRWYVRDAEAQADIAAIQEILQNGSRYIGKFTSAVVGGETVTSLKDGDVVTSITTSTGTYVTGTPTTGQKQLMAGDYCQNEVSGKSTTEWMWNGSSIDEFGSTSLLKSLAFKDSATGSVTAAGSNGDSTVTFASGAGSDFVTGYNDDAVAPTFSEGAFTPASLAEGFYSAGSAPSFSEGAFSQGTLPTLTPVSGENGLAFSPGTLPSKAADTFSAGSVTTLDLTKFNGGSKAADTFNAGSAATLAKSKALTASDTGTAAGQTFTGSPVSVIVS